MKSSINKKIALGASWSVALRWADKLIGLVAIAILARLLSPADFGLVGYAMILLGFLDQFTAFNFQTVLIRDQDAPEARYSSAWTLDVTKGIFLSILLTIGAQPAAAFFNEPKVEGIIYWIAMIPVLKGLVNVGIVNFEKALEFHKVFYMGLVVRLTGTIATVALAFALRNYWALVYGAIITAAVRMLISYAMSSFRPRICVSEARRVLGFSSWLLAQNSIMSINNQLPAVLIGRHFEAQAVGFFNIAKELTSLIAQQLTAPIRAALLPGILRIQEDHAQMESTLLSAVGVTILIGLPATIGIGVLAPLIVPAFLGGQWTGVTPIVTALCIVAALNLFYPNCNTVFLAQNRPHVTAILSFVYMAYMIPTMLLIVPNFGAVGAAWALVGVNGLSLTIDYAVLFRLTNLTVLRFVTVVWRAVLAVILMAFCVKLALDYPFTPAIQNSTILHLAICVISGVATYVATLTGLWLISGRPPGAEAHVLRALTAIYNRLKTVDSKTTE